MDWHQLTARPDFWGFVSIPIVAAVVTWIHVWFAMKMVFYPLEFHGVLKPWLGWQGIVPRKSGKMAGIVVQNTLGKIASMPEIFAELEPKQIARHISDSLVGRAEQLIDEIMNEKHPELWAKVPPAMRQPFYDQLRRQLPAVIDAMMKEIAEKIEEHIDLQAMIVRRLCEDKALIVRTFYEVGDREISFIVNSSFWIGMFFGVLQMALWYVWPFHWGLPLYGAALGYLTNWVALNMVFRPLEPVRVGPLRIQGVFLKRQAQVAEKFAALTTGEMITVKQIMTEIVTGEHADHTRQLMARHLAPLLEGGVVGAAIRSMLGPQGLGELQAAVVDKAAAWALEPLDDPAFIRERAAAIARVFTSRMSAMTPREFQDVLRPAFHEDEWILITLGAVFGFLAGWAQLAVGFR
jgi:uncharacterized membrane protein YheB (UPF0754 family)